jgi:hypothetical protein
MRCAHPMHLCSASLPLRHHNFHHPPELLHPAAPQKQQRCQQQHAAACHEAGGAAAAEVGGTLTRGLHPAEQNVSQGFQDAHGSNDLEEPPEHRRICELLM